MVYRITGFLVGLSGHATYGWDLFSATCVLLFVMVELLEITNEETHMQQQMDLVRERRTDDKSRAEMTAFARTWIVEHMDGNGALSRESRVELIKFLSNTYKDKRGQPLSEHYLSCLVSKAKSSILMSGQKSLKKEKSTLAPVTVSTGPSRKLTHEDVDLISESLYKNEKLSREKRVGLVSKLHTIAS